VGELSRNDLPERPGHAGWPRPTPEAQSLAPFEGRFAVLLHGAYESATIDLIERTADDVLLPLTGSTLRAALAVPADVHGVELEGEGLALSACKQSEDGKWMVLRCVNLTDHAVVGRWRCGFSVTDARLARLDETPLAPARHTGDAVEIHAAPRGVVTILVR
jgi:alpha-mannosidase